MAKFRAGLLLLFVSGDGFVSAANCDWQKIGELGAGFVLDQVPVAGGTLNRILNDFWPDDCAFKQIQSFINSRINKERRRRMSNKFKSFKSALTKARWMDWDSNPHVMTAFYMQLEGEKNLFMKNDLEDAVIYFR